MLSKFKSGFKLIGLNGETSSGGHGGGDKGGSEAAVGLGILVQISQGNKSKIIVKSALRFSQPTICSSLEFSCFLKTCHLCNKGLSLDKEVYMYRGDLGFCSIECRNRQIVIDDMKELEASTKQMIASYRRGLNRCTNTTSTNSRRDYSHKNVLEDVHLQHEQIPHQGKIIFVI